VRTSKKRGENHIYEAQMWIRTQTRHGYGYGDTPKLKKHKTRKFQTFN